MSAVLPSAGFPCARTTPVPTILSQSSINYYPAIDRATGASTSLESLVTINGAIFFNQVIMVRFTYDSVANAPIVSPILHGYIFLQGTQVSNPPGTVLPLDNTGYYWKQVL